MATNEFLKWDESDTNIVDYATYLAHAMRLNGFAFGTMPPSNLTNRFYRDCAAFVYAWTEHMKAQGIDASPDDIPALISNINITVPEANALLYQVKTVDGPGSGLDSDYLHGILGTYFVSGSGTYATTTSVVDADLIIKTGHYYANPWTNRPTEPITNAGFIHHIQSPSAGYATQIYYPLYVTTDPLKATYRRTAIAGTWSAWMPLNLQGEGVVLPATTGTMTATMDGDIKKITPTGACTFNATGGYKGQRCTFSILTSGTSSFVLTWGTNFKTTGTLSTGTVSGKYFSIDFIYDGTYWIETGRTTAI